MDDDDFDPILARRRQREAKARQRLTLGILAGGAVLAVLFAGAAAVLSQNRQPSGKPPHRDVERSKNTERVVPADGPVGNDHPQDRRPDPQPSPDRGSPGAPPPDRGSLLPFAGGNWTHQELAAHLRSAGLTVHLIPTADISGGYPTAWSSANPGVNTHPQVAVYLCPDARRANEKSGVSASGFSWGRFAFTADREEDIRYMERMRAALR